jgi:hypothetical protein
MCGIAVAINWDGAEAVCFISLAAVAPNTILCATSRRHPFKRRCSVRNCPSP